MMSRSVFMAFASLLAFGVSSSSYGAFQAYISVKGVKQGSFKGAAKSPARAAQGWTDATSVSTFDLGSGMCTGRRQHEPLSIRKEVDKASPMFAMARQTGESLTVSLELVRTGAGAEQVLDRVTLTDADVYSIENVREGTRTLEEISFRFRQITTEDLLTHKTTTEEF